MAASKSTKNPTKGNDTPNTPEVSESAIARMKVGELRRELQGRGVKGTADLKKPELVKKLIRLETAGAKPGRSAAKKSAGGNDTPNTPGVSESAIARMKVGELRRELQGRGVKGTADLKKPELVKKLIRLETAGAKPGRSAAKKSAGGNDTPNTPGVSESAIARMKVGELRRELQGRGVKGTADLKKPELVKKLVKLETAGAKPRRSATKKSKPAVATESAKKPGSVATTKKLAAAAMGRSEAKKVASAAAKLPTTKKLLFAQTDLPAVDEVPATVDVSEGRGSRGKANSRKRTGKATAVIR
ncbi:hypothetical protein COUCH_15840 [Couchioplanes caeruleus]|uniref:hypothetical protein n=1 Tax=Couchioplanes caeruleus TaxID=56438 RepID=UPI0020BEE6D7|nr:hypothetical protein [Couchioplanes caeruleus]UQU68798.1 hypothetical protein COUCH_15840 [Couchioplanes caeruleus]